MLRMFNNAPSDWIVTPLREVFSLASGTTKPYDTNSEETADLPIPVYGGNGITGYSAQRYHDGDIIIIGRVGEYCGVVHYVDTPCWITDNALYTKAFHREVSRPFLTYLLQQIQLRRFRNKTGQPLVSQQPIYTIKIPLPPLPEQRKIAEILSTWDLAIELTEKLIAAKERRKRALMQWLLTGKVRFPGFTEPWEEVRLGEVLTITYGKSANGVRSDEGDFPIVGTGGIIGYASQSLCHSPGIVIGRKGTIDQPQLIDQPFWPIDTTFYCIENEKCDLLWAYYALSRIPLGIYNESSGLPSLSHCTLSRIKIKAPSVPEQRAIAAILAKVDKEIESTEGLREEIQVQKRGLMQQLLTGKIRVKVEEE